MTESAKLVAEEMEQRLDDLAEAIQNRFDRITEGRFADQIRVGRFSGDRDAAEGGSVGCDADGLPTERGGAR
ncbi:hypothetical protein ACLQ2S_07670 [Micromonospora sp. DT48]|uniref:hypothetical protein n=1 Tax=Micromonospora sp. DT48 TaxID=3393429 RepID=UPI003CFA3630